MVSVQSYQLDGVCTIIPAGWCLYNHTSWMVSVQSYQLDGVCTIIPAGWCLYNHTSWMVSVQSYQLDGVCTIIPAGWCLYNHTSWMVSHTLPTLACVSSCAVDLHHRDGRLKRSDQIISINGHSLEGVPHVDAVKLLRMQSVRGRVELVVVRDQLSSHPPPSPLTQSPTKSPHLRQQWQPSPPTQSQVQKSMNGDEEESEETDAVSFVHDLFRTCLAAVITTNYYQLRHLHFLSRC